MTLRRLLTFAVVCAAGVPTAPAAQQLPIVGTWLLQSIVDTLPDHSVSYWMGRRPTGAIIYDATGHVAVEYVRDPSPRVAAPQPATPAELRDAYDGYYAYFGRYQVNARGDSVTHHVQISHRPNEAGAVYRRQVQVVGDRLVISFDVNVDGVQHRRVLTWRRAR
jgi:hypothetical protein